MVFLTKNKVEIMTKNTTLYNSASIENLGARDSSVSGSDTLKFGNFSNINYNSLGNGAIVSSANGLHATINTRLTKDIIFKPCCLKNDFNYYYDNNDNGGEGFGILIGNSESIEVC